MSQFLDLTFLTKASRELLVPGMKNQLYDEMPVLKILMGSKKEASGLSLITPVPLHRNVANGQFDGYSYISTQDQSLTELAALDWAAYYATVSISLTELKKNTGTIGKEKLIDMLQTKFNAAKMQLKENIYNDLFASVSNRGDFKTIVGTGVICTGTTGTYANINRATAGNEGWRSNVNTTTITDAELIDPTIKATYLPSVMRTLAHAASHDGSPTSIVTTKYLYELYEFIAETRALRLGGNTANLGFGDAKLSTKSSKQTSIEAGLFFDNYIPAKRMEFINPDNYQAFVFPGMDFDPQDLLGTGEWQRGSNQLAASMTIAFMGQILCDTPRQQAQASALGDA